MSRLLSVRQAMSRLANPLTDTLTSRRYDLISHNPPTIHFL
jgi:hypothetical protein